MVNLSSRKLQALALSAIVVSVAAGAFLAPGSTTIQQAYSLNAAGEPTLKVTGDASTSLVPDEATLIVNVQTQPGDLASMLDDQEEKIQEITEALLATGSNEFELTVSQRSVNPYYIYASAAINTNTDEQSDLVKSLRDAGLELTSVYDSSETIAEPVSGNETDSENPITVGVSLNTEPAVLTEALAEYEQKYRDLLAVLDGLGIPEDRIQQNRFIIYPYYGYSQTDGYNDYAQVIIKTPLGNIERMTNAIEQVDYAFIENVYLSVSDESIDDARVELTEQAIDDAEDRAEETAESLDFRIARITSIEVVPSKSSQYGDEIFYRGVEVVQPYYYQSITGEISVSAVVEFELQDET